MLAIQHTSCSHNDRRNFSDDLGRYPQIISDSYVPGSGNRKPAFLSQSGNPHLLPNWLQDILDHPTLKSQLIDFSGRNSYPGLLQSRAETQGKSGRYVHLNASPG